MTHFVVTPAMIYVKGSLTVAHRATHQYPTPAGLCSDLPTLLGVPHELGAHLESTIIIPADPTHGGGRQAVRTVIEGAGWKTAPTDGGWFTCRRGKAMIHLGVFEWLKDVDPLVRAACLPGFTNPTPWALAQTLDTWARATGAYYRHTPGVAAIAAIRQSGKWNTFGPKEFRTEPRWVLQDRSILDYWAAPAQLTDLRAGAITKKPTHAYHRWDTRAAYLAAASAVELPYRQLVQDAQGGPVGYYRVNMLGCDGDRLLLPAKADRQGTRWLGSSTLDLWRKRAVLEIVEAHTSTDRKTGRILRPWAEKWRDAMATHPDLRPVLKAGYAQALGGLLAVKSGTIYRPDWRHLIMDELRAQVTRRILRVWDLHHTWPSKVDVDSVYYDTDTPNAIGETLGVGERIGNMRYEGTV